MLSYLTNTSDHKSVVTGLLGLKSLVKKYEFELEDSRQGLYSILGESIGHMGALVNLVVNSEEEHSY